MKPLELMKDVGTSALKFGSKNSHIIMGVLAVGGLVGSVILSYKMRPKVDEIMEEQKTKMEDLEYEEDLTEEEKKTEQRAITRETVKRLAPVVAPTVICTILTGAAMASSVIFSENKIRQSTSLAIASDIAYRELYEKTKEIVGEEKAEEIKQAVAQDDINRQIGGLDEGELKKLEFTTYGGNDWFYDVCTRTLFQCDEDTIVNGCVRLERDITSGREQYVTYDEFYDEIGVRAARFSIPKGWMEGMRIEPNMSNSVKIGKKSVTLLDWKEMPIDLETIKRALR